MDATDESSGPEGAITAGRLLRKVDVRLRNLQSTVSVTDRDTMLGDG